PVTYNPIIARSIIIIWYLVLSAMIIWAGIILWRFIFTSVNFVVFRDVLTLGLYTALRVFAVLIISTLIWLPIGVWVGLRSNVAEIVQPVAQFLAAFPSNLLFPLVVILILRHNLNVDIWTTPLMLLGTQWYVLFNVIAGASALPKEL